MATGNWVGGRQGVAQRLDRINFLSMISHLQKVNSPLSSSQENLTRVRYIVRTLVDCARSRHRKVQTLVYVVTWR